MLLLWFICTSIHCIESNQASSSRAQLPLSVLPCPDKWLANFTHFQHQSIVLSSGISALFPLAANHFNVQSPIPDSLARLPVCLSLADRQVGSEAPVHAASGAGAATGDHPREPDQLATLVSVSKEQHPVSLAVCSNVRRDHTCLPCIPRNSSHFQLTAGCNMDASCTKRSVQKLA